MALTESRYFMRSMAVWSSAVTARLEILCVELLERLRTFVLSGRFHPPEELAERDDLDAFEFSQIQHGPVTGDNQPGAASKGALQNPVVRIVRQHLQSFWSQRARDKGILTERDLQRGRREPVQVRWQGRSRPGRLCEASAGLRGFSGFQARG